MPGEAYHAVEALSASGAKKVLRSPLHYKLFRTQPSEPTAVMQFGTAAHCGILEPARFHETVICVPADAPKRPTIAQIRAAKPSPETVAAINFWQAFNRNCIGKVVLDAADYARVERCIDAVLSHPAASQLLADSEREVSLFWRDGRYDVPCKARLDIRSHGGITDVKTCTDASPETFGRQAASLLYHVQGAMYFNGCEHVLDATPEFFGFICVESEEPHAVACYVLDTAALLAGAHLCNIALERYAQALKSGKFPGYPSTIERLPFPRWALQFPA